MLTAPDPQLMQEVEPQVEQLPQELEPLVAAVSPRREASETSMISNSSKFANMLFILSPPFFGSVAMSKPQKHVPMCVLLIATACSLYHTFRSKKESARNIFRQLPKLHLSPEMASKVFWSQKTPGGDSDESPPFA